MKGISNILPSFTRTVLCVLCALGLSLGAYAQSRTATVNVKDVTVKELLKAIEAGSSYTFAYVDTDIDLAGKVSVTASASSATATATTPATPRPTPPRGTIRASLSGLRTRNVSPR